MMNIDWGFDVGAVGFSNKYGMSVEEGVYLVNEDGWGEKDARVSIYPHPEKGLCCYCDEGGSWFDTELPDEFSDGHIPVNYSYLEFVAKVGELKVE